MAAQNVSMDGSYGSVVWNPPKTYKAMQKMCHDDLTRPEVASLKFLCKDVVSAGKLEEITSTLQLFETLESLGLMTSEQNMSILIELLYYINRKDILSKLKVTREYISAVLDRPKISSYRILLFNICENILKKDLEDLKFLCGDIGLASSAVESIKTAEDLILLLERSGKLNEDDFSSLESLLTNACKLDLVQRIEEYKSKHPAGQKSLHDASRTAQQVEAHVRVVTVPRDSMSDQFKNLGLEDVRGANGNDPPNIAISDREARIASPTDDQTKIPDTDIGGDTLDTYPMNKPGFCFIINNLKFIPGSKHKDRVGSEIDEKNLIELFRRTLRFEVEVRNDLMAQQMVAELHNVARHINNDKYSCFVCCILTHGTDGAVYGVDDVMVTIRGMMEMFKVEKCPGMRNKPKIFFLQACQGTKRDIYLDASVDEGEPEEKVVSLPEMDAPNPPPPGSGSIPSERDFLLAYSAVPGYASFRSRTEGTYFISTLVEVLREMHGSTDLMGMLTMVTGRVSHMRAPMNGKDYYQVPAPIQTLTKLLFWK